MDDHRATTFSGEQYSAPHESARPPRRGLKVLAGLLIAAALGTAGFLSLPRAPEEKPPPPDTPELSEAERQFLWDVEHGGTVLSKHGFAQISAALKGADREALTALLADDFTARLPSAPRTVQSAHEGIRGMRQESDEQDAAQASTEEFLDYLLEQRAPFGKPPRCSIALMNMSPVERMNLESVWAGGLRLKLAGEAREGQPREATLFLKVVIDPPTEERLAEGGWLHSARVTESVVVESDHYLMQNVTSDWGIDATQYHDNWSHAPMFSLGTPGGVYAFDYNRDGVTDLFVTEQGQAGNRLYRGLPQGGFEHVTEAVGIPKVHETKAIVADLDGDGWEDIVLGEGSLFRNLEGERFEHSPTLSNLIEVGEMRSVQFSGAAVADFDRDGLLDLYLCRGNSRPDQGSWLDGNVIDGRENLLLRNLGDFRFENVTERCGASGGKRSTFTAVWFDANNDRWPDLYVINEFGDGVLLVNETGKRFREVDLVQGDADFGSMGVTCGDIDNDGRTDVYVASMYSKSGARVIGNLRPDTYPPEIMHRLQRMVAGSQLYHNGDGLKFNRVGEAFRVADVGWAYGPSLSDFDNDGWLDIYATTGFLSRTRDEPDG